MAGRLIIDGNSVYEIDEECERNRDRMMKRPGTRRNRGGDKAGRESESKKRDAGPPGQK